jgi:glycosyltransferase involved in cell wall biosynthesis
LRIGIDVRFAVHKRRGVGNYALKLVNNLARIDSSNEYVLYIDKEDVDKVLPQKSNFKIKKIFPSNYLVWEQIVLPLHAKKDGVDILHCTGNTAPILLDKRIKLIISVHDVMYLKDYSELPRSVSRYQRMGRLYRKAVVPKAINHLSMALTVSEFSKKDIMRHIPKLDGDRIKVVYEAANESYSQIDKILALQKIRNKFGFEGDYILTLGALDPRKNTELVIRKFIELKNESNLNQILLVVGVSNWKQTGFYNIVRESGFEKDIIFADFVSEDELVLLYNGASVFLYPSLYEGFGMPLLEAMACGTPVITSNVTSMPEIAGDAAFLINPNNGEELKAAVLKLLNDGNLRNDLIARGLKRAGQFSWVRMAEDTLTVYDTVYNEQSK